MNPVGHPPDHRREAYVRRYGLTGRSSRRVALTQNFMDQLDRCKSDEARKLLLGIREEHDESGTPQMER